MGTKNEHDSLAEGLYEQLVSARLKEKLTASQLEPRLAPLDENQQHVLAQHVHDLLLRALRDTKDLDRQVTLANDLVATLAKSTSAVGSDEAITTELLLSLSSKKSIGLGDGEIQRPRLPVSHSDMLMNGRRDLSLLALLRSELPSADRVDVIMAFIKWTGFVELRDSFRNLLGRGRPLRILTTTYMRATEPQALEALYELGAEIRVSYDSHATRLHAKAWLFHRDSGYSTAVVGSSNLSKAALRDGREWNVRLTEIGDRVVVRKVKTAFEQYWSDGTFEPYDRERYRDAVAQTRTVDFGRDVLAGFARLSPYPHQQAVLDALASERERGHTRNLIVAATGTGKTVTAALDYARLEGQPSLLFVAHRYEILQQSRSTFQAALHDGNFGELQARGERPIEGRHVFASIQSLNANQLSRLAPDAFDVVIVDEFHHAAAPTYRALLEHLKPKILVGLTATPERADGQSILGFFDGRVAAEGRLWEALDEGLLSPFQYFMLTDTVDVSDVDFRKGRYDIASLESLVTGDEARARHILAAVHDHVRDGTEMKALGFCVSVKHAEYMAEYFTRHGIPSEAVSGKTKSDVRARAITKLTKGQLACLFTVDLFNEGVDIPVVDTVLFLRPTESATVFMQQLGRGLRRHETKSCLTALDFVGHGRCERFDLKLRALVGGGTRKELTDAIERGFPTLPSGCSIHLEEVPRTVLLENLRRTLGSWARLADDLTEDMSLDDFLRRSETALPDLYKPGKTFSELRAVKGYGSAPEKSALTRALPRTLHVDDAERLDAWTQWLASPSPPKLDRDDVNQAMLFAAFGQARVRKYQDMGSFQSELWKTPVLREEAAQLYGVLRDRVRHQTYEVPSFPLRAHAHYARAEVMAALRLLGKKGKLLELQSGVYKCDAHQCDLFFVTLNKNPKTFSPTTLYEDFPISRELFHWESQGKTRAESKTGLRYQNPPPGWRTMLFVRDASVDSRGETMPFLFLGPVHYEKHESECPMRITWKLERPAPASWFARTKIAAG